MRKNYTKILMVAVVLFTGVSTEAYAFNAEGIYYNITSEADTTVEVTSGSKVYAGDITIPVKVSYNGKVYTVASIGNKAFYYCRSLTSVNIPDSLTSIGEDAFYCCSNLESVILGDTLLTIGGKAFYYCSKLATIDIPDKVTSIGNSAFSGCSSLTRLGLGKSLSVIDSYAFYACSGLTEIYCAASVPPSCRSYCFLNVDKSACTLYVPEGTADDYKKANEWKDFYNIVETDFHKEGIVDGINYKITSLANRTVGVIAKENGYSADIKIPSSIEFEGTIYAVTSIETNAFANSWVNSVDIPESVTIIKENAFYGCSWLKNIKIPDSVTEIGNSAFYACPGLEYVILGRGLKTIGTEAFLNSGYVYSSLTEVFCYATTPPLCMSRAFHGDYMSQCTLYVPEGTTDIYKAANVWKEFYNIVETDFAGTEEIAADAAADVTVYAAAGRIVVENAAAGTPIAVYSADGVLIYGGTVSDTFTEIPAPAGKLYIVKCGSAVFKTVM